MSTFFGILKPDASYPMPEVEKESAEHLADYDMSIGSLTLEQDDQVMVNNC